MPMSVYLKWSFECLSLSNSIADSVCIMCSLFPFSLCHLWAFVCIYSSTPVSRFLPHNTWETKCKRWTKSPNTDVLHDVDWVAPFMVLLKTPYGMVGQKIRLLQTWSEEHKNVVLTGKPISPECNMLLYNILVQLETRT